MKPLHVLWNKPTDAGTYTGGSWVATGGLALTNLTTQDVMELARSTDAAEASTWFRVDFGRTVPLSMFAILNHNGSPAARRRHVVTNDPTNSGAPVYDTGLERMRARTDAWGTRPFGAFPFDGLDRASYPGGTIDLHIAPGRVYGRYLFTFLADPGNPAGYLQAGRLMAGEVWTQSMAFGVKLRTADPSEPRRTRGGRRLVRRLPRYREVSITFEHMTERDAMATAFEIERQLGKSGDFLLVYDPDDVPSVRFRRTVYAALSETTGITTTTATMPRRYGWGITAEELI